MPIVEIMTIEVGSAIAKSILKLWLKDSTIAQDVSSSLVDLLKSRTSDVIAQRRGQRQFEIIGEKVGESLLPIFEVEGAHLDEGSRAAVALAVAETFNKSKISSELLVERNLEPTRLAKYLTSTHPTATQHFSAAETALYERIINESCNYIVDIASQLPAFAEHSFAEVLKREDQLLAITVQILQVVQKMREQQDPMAKATQFEFEYRRALTRKMDILELFGTDVSNANRRNRLSVAYIMLKVIQKFPGTPGNANRVSPIAIPQMRRPQDEFDSDAVPVDKALANSRCLLIRGLAGSGKTTLLQWIAVRSASRSFEGRLADWNNTIPFHISLRQCVQSGLPAPETFPRLVTPAIAGKMPEEWVHKELESGRAIVLVDGLDEMPAFQREDVRTWLKDLVVNYPEARYILTSRPHAAEENWMDSEGFSDAELQPMQLPDVYAFIDHWHQAVQEELLDEEEKAELKSLAEHLKEEVRDNPSKRNLVTSPLLCAMLCALNRERRQQLPSDRIELYEACCKLLLERRDKDRRIELSDYPVLNYRQKLALLEDLAYWMVKNGWREVDLSDVDSRFDRKLKNMLDIPLDVSGAEVRRFFVERAGIIREPVVGKINFTHLTFQEYLAAYAALDEVDIGVLVQNAHNDQWREVIILASGLATRPIREKLLQALITRGDEEKEHRYQLHLLAVSCLETPVELEQELRSEIEKRLSNLVPPKSMVDAKALAAAGELAIRHLTKSRQYPASTTAACVRTLSLIGSNSALEALVSYARDTRSTVVDELVRAWDSFDKENYARQVLSQALQGRYKAPANLSSLSGFQYLTNVTELGLMGCGQISDLTPLANLTQLKWLSLAGCEQVSDLTPLASLTQLTELDLANCRQISDLAPLANLTQLKWLSLTGCGQISDLTPLANLTQLTKLDLPGCGQISDLTPLANLIQLTELDLMGCGQISDLTPLTNLTQLSVLDLTGCRQISNLSSLASLTRLKWLSLVGCEQVSDLTSLASLTQLTELDLANCRRISDLTPLANLTCLTELNLALCEQASDLMPLANLTQLTELDLAECKQVSDLMPLANLTQLTKLNLADCERVSDLTPLTNLMLLSELDLGGCKQVSDLTPLASLLQLTELDLANCKLVSDLTALKGLNSLNMLGLRDLPDQVIDPHGINNRVQISRQRVGFGKWIMISASYRSLDKLDRRKKSYEHIVYSSFA